jgi:predicted dienelactone hydrolase
VGNGRLPNETPYWYVGTGHVMLRAKKGAIAMHSPSWSWPGLSRSARFAGLSVLLAVGLLLIMARPAAAGPAADLPVGYKVKTITVPGSAQGERRKVDVHLWYPADPQNFAGAPTAVYTSALHGRPLPKPWEPLSWTVQAEIAGKNAAIDPNGPAFPVIVFSHGNQNDPIDYAHTLELIAGAGFVVAAPSHTNNTQDDVRIDYINAQAEPPEPEPEPEPEVFKCNDKLPPPCSRTNVPFSMADRARDISTVLDKLPGWFEDRVDLSRVGVMGHSRGTVTALAAAGGSAPWSLPPTTNCQTLQPADNLCWPLVPDPRVKAVMGLAIGAPAITRGVNLANVTVPTLLVAGGLDRTSPPAVSQFALDNITSTQKTLITIPNATHRSFDSTYCDQTQAAGAIAKNKFAILDQHTLEGIVVATAAPNSGKAMDYCSYPTFTEPTNITRQVEELTGFRPTKNNVPTTGLDTDQVKQTVTELAVPFFDHALNP